MAFGAARHTDARQAVAGRQGNSAVAAQRAHQVWIGPGMGSRAVNWLPSQRNLTVDEPPEGQQ
jgi:hypothetical protein